jgi:hypothetical protein
MAGKDVEGSGTAKKARTLVTPVLYAYETWSKSLEED